MARSPLLSLLQRLHRAQRLSARTGVPALEVLERASEERAARRRARAGLSRRDALKLFGVVGALPLVEACPTAENPIPNGGGKKVAVVGAGIAGLHCAVRLKELGIVADVLEAQDRLGGRMLSDRETFADQDGQHCELGGELIDTGHATMLALADDYGIELLDYQDDDASLDAVVAYFNGARLDIADVLTDYAPIAARIDSDVASLTSEDNFVTYYDPGNGAAIDALSIKAWFDQLETDGVIQAGNLARQLFEVAFNIEYGLETDEQNVLNMLYLTSTDTSSLALFGDSDERFHTAGGNDLFIQNLAADVQDQITTGAKLVRIATGSDGRHTLSFDGAADKTYDHVVLALPFTMLREVELDGVQLSAAKDLAIRTLGYGTNAKLMLGFDEKVWRTQHDSNGETFSDLGYQSTWETSRLQPGDKGIITHYTGGDAGVAAGAGTPAERAAAFLTQFEQVFAGVQAAHNGKVARFHWPTNDFVKASYACYLPGQYSTITGSEIEAEADNTLHFCGEHTSLDAQGYMEGGALTGAAAADEVAAALGVDASSQVQALHADSPRARIWQLARAVRTQRRWRKRRAPR